MVFKRPTPLDLSSSTPPSPAPSASSFALPSSPSPASPSFKFWKRKTSAVPPPPPSPTFALSNSPLHPSASARLPPPSPSKGQADGKPAGILLRPQPTSSSSRTGPTVPLGPSTNGNFPLSTSGSAATSSRPPVSQQRTTPTRPPPPAPPATETRYPTPPPTPRRSSSGTTTTSQSNSSDSLSRRSGAVFPESLDLTTLPIGPNSPFSFLRDLPAPPAPGPAFASNSNPNEERRSSEGVVSTRRTGTRTTWGAGNAKGEPSPPLENGRRFGHGRKRSNSMSNIPLYAGSTSSPPTQSQTQDDTHTLLLNGGQPPSFSSRPFISTRRTSPGPSPLHLAGSSRAPPTPSTTGTPPPTRTTFAMRSSRPSAPGSGKGSFAFKVPSPPPAQSSENVHHDEKLMSGFPSFHHPQLSTFRTLDRLHSLSPPPRTALPALPTSAREEALPEVWVIPATPDLAAAEEEGSPAAAGEQDDDNDDALDVGGAATQGPSVSLRTDATALKKKEGDALSLSTPSTTDGDENDAGKDTPTTTTASGIDLDFGFDFGSSFKFGSNDSLSAILASSQARGTSAGTDAGQSVEVVVEESQSQAGEDLPVEEEEEEEDTTPKLVSLPLIDRPTSPVESLASLESSSEDDGRQSRSETPSELDTELARMIESLSEKSLATLPAVVTMTETHLLPSTSMTSSHLSPNANEASPTPSSTSSGSISSCLRSPSTSLEAFPTPPVRRQTPSPTHSHSAPVLAGLGLGLSIDESTSGLLARRRKANLSTDSGKSTGSSPVLVRDHRRPFYLSSTSTPANLHSTTPLTPPPTAQSKTFYESALANSQVSPSDCYLPRGETLDDLSLFAKDQPSTDLAAWEEEVDVSDDEDGGDNSTRGLAVHMTPSNSFSTGRSTTLSTLSSVDSNLHSTFGPLSPPPSAVAQPNRLKQQHRRQQSSLSSIPSSSGHDAEYDHVEISRVTTMRSVQPLKWAFASAGSVKVAPEEEGQEESRSANAL